MHCGEGVCGLVLVMVVLFTSLRRAGFFQRQVGTLYPRTLFRALAYLSPIAIAFFYLLSWVSSRHETLLGPGGMFKIFPLGDLSIIGRIFVNLDFLHEGTIGNDCRYLNFSLLSVSSLGGVWMAR